MFLKFNRARGVFNSLLTEHILVDSNIFITGLKNKKKKLTLKTLLCKKQDLFYLTECVVKEILFFLKDNRISPKTISFTNVTILKCYHKRTYGDKCIANIKKKLELFKILTFDLALNKNNFKNTY